MADSKPQDDPLTDRVDSILTKAAPTRDKGMSDSPLPKPRLKPGTTAGLPLAGHDALASIAGSVLRASSDSERRTLLVTSANRGEGKTTIASNIAFSLAQQAGASTVIVDANFHGPRLHELFEVQRDPGIDSALMDRLGLESTLHATDQKHLYFMTLGDSEEGFLTMFNPLRVRHVLEHLSRMFHVVVFDGPPVFGPADPAVIAGCFSQILLVVECESTRWEVVQSAKARLQDAGGLVTGAILNRRKHYIPPGLYKKMR